MWTSQNGKAEQIMLDSSCKKRRKARTLHASFGTRSSCFCKRIIGSSIRNISSILKSKQSNWRSTCWCWWELLRAVTVSWKKLCRWYLQFLILAIANTQYMCCRCQQYNRSLCLNVKATLTGDHGSKKLCQCFTGRAFYRHGGRTRWPKQSDRVAQSVRADGTSVLGCAAVSL